MKSMNVIKGNINDPQILESLKANLDGVGVRAFTINFETNIITVMTPKDLMDKDLSCAIVKSGIQCTCLQKCIFKELENK